MDLGQNFSFIATADCERLRFRVPGSALTKIPKAGPDRGTADRTYKVVLTESEWNSLVDEGDTTFTWSIIGTTSAGVTTRVTTTNELKTEGGVTIDLSTADAKLVGEESFDYAGVNVSGAGDVDGNGHDDLLVGAINVDGGDGAGDGGDLGLHDLDDLFDGLFLTPVIEDEGGEVVTVGGGAHGVRVRRWSWFMA